MRIKLQAILVIICIAVLSGCATVYNPATQKNEFIIFSTQEEIAIGNSLSQQINAEYELLDDNLLHNRVQEIGNNVAIVSDRPDLEYHFFVIDDNELNAFALPGGFIYVNKGVLDQATDSELAGVLGHEIGHVAARHSVKKLQTALGYQFLMSLAFGKSSANTIDALNVVFNVVSQGYSREDERLADRLGIKYMHNAGYDPNAVVSFFEKLKLNADKAGPHFNLVFLSSHPAIEERIKNAKDEIAKLNSEESADSNNQNFDNAAVNSSGNITSLSPDTNTKICPSCKKQYPSNYQFCTIDGRKLNKR